MNALARGSTYALAALIALSLTACSETIGGIGPSSHIAEVEAGPRDQESNSGNLASLTEVIARNPSDAPAYNTRGVVYAKLGRYSDAIDDFSRAIELDPHFAGAYTNRALAYRQERRDDLAMQDFNRAVAVNPKDGYPSRVAPRRYRG
jgi:Tfp pilus assembly protein PilF